MFAMANWWERIQEEGRKVKAFSGDFLTHDILIVMLVILVGVASFGLGRLSALEETRPAVRILHSATVEESPIVIGGKYVVSRRGSKYHFPWCPGARAMNENNKIWFDSIEDAQQAGYAPAGNCAGLE